MNRDGGPDNPDDAQTLARVEQFAEELNDRPLQCRTFDCQKQPSTVHIVQLEGSTRKVLEIGLVCRNRCGCTWTQMVDPKTGQPLTRLKKHYPPKGYLAPGIGRLYGDKKAILRLEYIKRNYITEEK